MDQVTKLPFPRTKQNTDPKFQNPNREMMEQKNIKNFKKLVADLRTLTTKVQKDNQNQTKNLKDTNLVLEACKKEYQKLYLEHRNLKKNTNCLNIETITKVERQPKLQLLRIERLNLVISTLTKKN